MLQRLGAVLFLFAASLAACVSVPVPAHAQTNPRPVSESVAICDPKFPGNCIKPAADGSIPVSGGGGGGGGGAVTAVSGAFAEGSIVVLGRTDDLCATDDTGAATMNARMCRALQKLTALGTPLQDSRGILCGAQPCVAFTWVNPTTGAPVDPDSASSVLLTTADYGSAGSPTAHVLSVQGVNGGTAQNVQALDARPTQNTMSAADVGSTTSTGQGGVTLVAGTPTTNSFQKIDLNGQSGVTMQVTGTFVGTGVIEGSADGGTTWVVRGGQLLGLPYTTSAVTGPGVWSIDASGMTNIRVRFTAYTSGTATVKYVSTPAAGLSKVLNGVSLTGGCTPYHLSGGTTASTNSTLISATARSLCHLVVINTGATLGYLKIYDTATAPTCSSATNIKHVYPVPTNSTSGAGFVIPTPTELYANGIGFCYTGGGTDTDNTNGAAGVFIEASTR